MNLEKNYSDKVFWHKYISFYEANLPQTLNNILEIGIFNGESIKYWRKKYPHANIYGMDILPPKPIWPMDKNINYFQVDISDKIQYRKTLENIKENIDLIIEDGSHDPLHQKTTLIESLDFLKENSTYILEDIHTSHPNHPMYKSTVVHFNKSLPFFEKRKKNILMSLQCLLFIDHLKSNNIDFEKSRKKINFKQSLFNYDELYRLYKKVKKISFYKRTVLPEYCYLCKSSDFDYINLRCSCGAELYSEYDSMSALIKL